jgi:hypothetical protein
VAALVVVLPVAFWSACSPEQADYKVSKPFELGARAVFDAEYLAPSPGRYLLLLKLPGIDRARFAAEKMPVDRPAKFHLTMRSADRVLMDTNLTSLPFDFIDDDRKVLVYHVSAISIDRGEAISVRLEDSAIERHQSAAIVFVRARAK